VVSVHVVGEVGDVVGGEVVGDVGGTVGGEAVVGLVSGAVIARR
jgi:hypothetical protein